MDALVETPGQVLHHRIGMCEVDRHLCRLSRRPVIADVYRRDELQAFSRFDSTTDFRPHPATGSKNRNLHILRHGTLLSPRTTYRAAVSHLLRTSSVPTVVNPHRPSRPKEQPWTPVQRIRVTLDLPAVVVGDGAEA